MNLPCALASYLEQTIYSFHFSFVSIELTNRVDKQTTVLLSYLLTYSNVPAEESSDCPALDVWLPDQNSFHNLPLSHRLVVLSFMTPDLVPTPKAFHPQ